MPSSTLTVGPAQRDETDQVTFVGSQATVAAVAQIVRALSLLPGSDRVLELLRERLTAVSGEAEREAQVLDALLPPVHALSDVATTQLRWNAVAREEALREFGAFTSGQLAELRGAQTTNPHANTSRWLSAGRIFALETSAGRLFPAFQFLGGKPRPVVAKILERLRDHLSGWELLLWFTASNGNLDGERPVDLLERAPERVIAAADYQASLSQD